MHRVHLYCSLVLLLGFGTAHAEQDGPAPINTTRSVSAGADDDIITQGDDRSRVALEPGHADGTYMGVAPGAGAQPPAAAAARKKAPLTITWPGFQMRPDGSSRVFIQSTAPLETQPSAAAGRYALHLPNARIAAETNRLPLDTRYFNTPVTRVSLKADRGGATLLLELRSEVTPQISSEQGNAGYYFTYIELPKGSYMAGASPAPAPEAASPAAVSGKAEPRARTKANGRIRLGD